MSLSSSERIARLESLLARVTTRAKDPRPARPLAAAPTPSPTAAPAPAQAAAPARAPQPPAPQPPAPVAVHPPPAQELELPTPPSSTGRHSARPPAPQLEVLPELGFPPSDESEESPTIAAEAAPRKPEADPADADGDLEFAPPRSVIPRATTSKPALESIEMPQGDVTGLEIDHTPLAAAVNAKALEAEESSNEFRIPPAGSLPLETFSPPIPKAPLPPSPVAPAVKPVAPQPPKPAAVAAAPGVVEPSKVAVAHPVVVSEPTALTPASFRGLLERSLALTLSK